MFKTSLAVLLRVSKPLSDHFKATLGQTMLRLFQDSISTSIGAELALFPFDTATHPQEKLAKSLDIC